MKSKLFKMIVVAALLGLALSACTTTEASTLRASGNLSANDAAIAPELSGKVVSIAVEEGQSVTAGQTLFQLDDSFYRVQRDQAAAAVKSAEAAVEAARKQAASAQAQYELTMQAAQAQDVQNRAATWNETLPDGFRAPWYFQKDERIAAAEQQVNDAKSELATAQADLKAEQEKASSQDFIAAEERLAQAQGAYEVARKTLDLTIVSGSKDLESAAQEKMDEADAELNAARLKYEQMLSTSAADAITKSRARLAIAQSTLDNARDALMMLQTGGDNLQVRAAQAAAEAAVSQVNQAEAGLEQAREALKLAELQLARAAVTAPSDGVVLTRSLEVGEMISAGGTVMRMANLDRLNLIVYIAEDLYGRVKLGDSVTLSVDSYAGQVFTGRIIHIADEAEYTARNVQTEQGRKSSVYAVKIQVDNSDQKLKPGMPADVDFNLH